MAESVETIEKYICDYINIQPGNTDIVISPASNYVEEGFLDSFAILSLIMDLESCYGIKFKTQELVEEKIKTISGLALMVCEKHAAVAVRT